MEKTIQILSKKEASIASTLRPRIRRFDRYFKHLGYPTTRNSINHPKFDAILISTADFKFDRDEANAR